jgi:hypothetical protein
MLDKQPKFKVGDIVIDNKSKDIAIILGINHSHYKIQCIDAGDGVYNTGVDHWAITGVDSRSRLHEESIVDKVLNKYL